MSPMEEDEEGLYPSFDHQTIYDAPANMLGQLLDGEASWAGFRATFLSPDRMSPLERHNARERLREAAGNTAPGNLLVNLATNPFVWALFAFSPAGAKAVRSGKRIFGNTRDSVVGKRFVGYVKDKRGLITTLLDGMGLLSGRQKVEDTPVAAIVSAAASRRMEIAAKWEHGSGAMQAQERLLERIEGIFGLSKGSLGGLDPESAPHAVASVGGSTVTLRSYLERANRVIWARMSGVDADRLVERPTVERLWMASASRKREDGSIEIRNVTLTKEHAEEITERLGAASRALADSNPAVRAAGAKALVPQKVTMEDGEWEVASLPTQVPDGTQFDAMALARRVVSDPKGRIGPDQVRFGEVQSEQAALVSSAKLDRAIEEMGLGDFISSNRRMLDMIRDDLFLEKPGGEVSESKLKRLWRWVAEGKALDPSAPVDEEDLARLSIAESMFGRPMLDRIRRGEMTEAEWVTGAKSMVSRQVVENSWYFPRNTTSRLGVNGELIPEEEAISRNRARKWTGGSMAQLRTGDALPLSPRDLEALKEFAGPKELKTIENALGKVRSAWEDSMARGEAMPVLTADAARGLFTHVRRASRDMALAVDDITDEERRAWVDLMPNQAAIGERPLPKFSPPMPKEFVREGEEKVRSLGMREWPLMVLDGKVVQTDRHPDVLPAGGMARFDLLKAMVGKDGVVDPQHAEFIRETVMPRMMGEAPIRSLFLWSGIRKAKAAAAVMADSAPMAALERSGGVAGGWVTRLREWGRSNTMLNEGSRLSGSVASWLYASHLGANPGSVILNLTQPFLHGAAWMGGTEVVKAYPKAMAALGAYMAERVRFGPRMKPSERQALLAKHFDFGQEGHSVLPLLGITDDLLDQLDGVALSQMGRQVPGKFRWAAIDLPMIPFKMSERLNRLVTARSVEGLYVSKHGQKAWKDPKIRSRMLSDMEGMVQRTQFGPGVLDQPEIFLKQLDSPILRMFLSFPVRSATALLETGQGILQRGERGIAVDALRMMGVSAVIYEAGKQLFGGDLTRGLAADSMSILLGGERFVQEANLAVPAPPAIDIAYGLARGVALGDAEALRSTLPRLVPGGISLSRAIGTAPPLPDPVGALQKQTVDWGTVNAEGQVPVYDAQGQLVKWAHPGDVVLRAMGMDLGRWGDSAKLTRWMVANRERIVDYRRRYMQAVLAGEMSRANAIRDEYQTAYGLPLTVAEDQWKRAIQVRERPVAERSFDMVAKDMRAAFSPALASRREVLGMPSRDQEEVERRLTTPAATRFEDRPSAFGAFEVPEGY